MDGSSSGIYQKSEFGIGVATNSATQNPVSKST